MLLRREFRNTKVSVLVAFVFKPRKDTVIFCIISLDIRNIRNIRNKCGKVEILFIIGLDLLFSII